MCRLIVRTLLFGAVLRSSACAFLSVLHCCLGFWLRWYRLPGVVGADAPHVAFEVATGEVAATVVHVTDVDDHLGTSGFCGGVYGISVRDYEVGTLGFAEADLIGLDHEFSGFAAVVDGAEHDHAVAVGELGVLDGFVVGGDEDRLFFEAEGGDEPVDGAERVAVAEAGDDG